MALVVVVFFFYLFFYAFSRTRTFDYGPCTLRGSPRMFPLNRRRRCHVSIVCTVTRGSFFDRKHCCTTETENEKHVMQELFFIRRLSPLKPPHEQMQPITRLKCITHFHNRVRLCSLFHQTDRGGGNLSPPR